MKRHTKKVPPLVVANIRGLSAADARLWAWVQRMMAQPWFSREAAALMFGHLRSEAFFENAKLRSPKNSFLREEKNWNTTDLPNGGFMMSINKIESTANLACHPPLPMRPALPRRRRP